MNGMEALDELQRNTMYQNATYVTAESRESNVPLRCKKISSLQKKMPPVIKRETTN